MTSTRTAIGPQITPGLAGRSPTRTVAFACLAIFVSYLPFSAVNGALGAIGAATGAATADLQWFTAAFALVLAATVLSAGVLSDLLGRRTVTLAGLGLTTVGALVGTAAGSLEGAGAIRVLWLAQGLAGFGAAAVMSATLGLVAAVSPDLTARRRAIAWWAAATTAGLGAGPFLAAAALSWTSWRWLFAPIAVLAVAVAALGGRTALESASPQGRRLDVSGQAISALGIAALVYAVIRGGTDGWADTITLTAFGLALVGLAAFVVVERRSPSPLLRPELFTSHGFTAAGIAAATTLFSLVGTVFTLSLLFAHQGVTGLQIAALLGALFAANALASLLSAPAQARFGAPGVLIAGLVLAAVGTALLATTGVGLGDHAWRLVVLGLGGGLAMATTSTVAVSSVPLELAGMAGSVNNALRQVGAALGAAVLGSVLAGRLAAGSSFPAAAHFCAGVLTVLLVLAAVACTVLLVRRPTLHPATA